MDKLQQLRDDLRGECQNSSCCLWLSGGKDSRLLLVIILQEKLLCGFLSFREGWTTEQNKIVNDLIKQHNLAVYSYPPEASILFGENDDLTVASVYAVGSRPGETTAILRDIVPGDACAAEIMIKHNEERGALILFDTHIWGSKKSDRHYVFGEGAIMTDAHWNIGTRKFFAPLYNWTDAEVLEALGLMGAEYAEPSEQQNTGNLPCCSRCLTAKDKVMCPKTKTEIPAIQWSPTENLAAWREQNIIRSV